MPVQLVTIKVLGASFSIQTDESREYMDSLLSELERRLESLSSATRVSDPLKALDPGQHHPPRRPRGPPPGIRPGGRRGSRPPGRSPHPPPGRWPWWPGRGPCRGRARRAGGGLMPVFPSATITLRFQPYEEPA